MPARPIRFALLPVGIALCGLVLVELALQVRSHLRTGQSVFNAAAEHATYVADPTTGLVLFRPSAIIRGSQMEMRTNSWGLRSDQIADQPRPDETRIALLGASTIQGTYAPTNEDTSAATLARKLAGSTNLQNPVVLNAGVAGLTVAGQVTLLTKRLLPAGTRIVYWYPGSNDITCTRRGTRTQQTWRMPLPVLPDWLLTRELIVKNTAFLRPPTKAAARKESKPVFDVVGFERALRKGADASIEAGAELRLVTTAVAYHSRQPVAERQKSAASALFFRPCYTVDELIANVARMNAVIKAVAAERGLLVVDAAAAMTGSVELFGDASHFSVAGEQAFSQLLADDLGSRPPVTQ